MKRTMCAIMALLLIGTAAMAATPKLSQSLFDCAKAALVGLAAGDYEDLSDALPFSGTAPGPSQWQKLAEGFDDLGDVQTEYAVAFFTGDIWVIAVPVQPPANGSVEALAFSSADGASFDAFRYATWSQVEKACGESSRVIWDREYVGGSATVVADLGEQE